MAIDRSEYSIKITTEADAAPVEKYAAAVKKVGESAKEAGPSHKEVHEAFKLAGIAAGDALGPIGELGHFLASPELLGVAGAVLAFKMLTEQMTATREAALKQLEAFTQFHDFLASNHQAAMIASEAQLHAWNLQLEHARDNIDTLTQAMERNIVRGQESLHNTADLISAQERLAEATIHAREVSGQTTPAGASEETRQAQEAARHAHEAAEDHETQAEIEAKRARAARTGGEIDSASNRLTGLREDRRTGNEAIGLADNRIEEMRQASEEATKAANEAKNNLAHPMSTLGAVDAARAIADPTFMSKKMGELEETAASSATTAETKKEELKTAIKHKAALEDQQKTVEEDIKSQQDLITSRNALRDKLIEEAAAAEDSLRTRQAGRAEVENVDRQTDAVNRRTANIETAQRVQSGRGTPAEQAQVGDWQAQAGAASERGPQLGSDISSAIYRGQSVLSAIRGGGGRGNADQMAEVHQLLNSITGYLEGHSMQAQSQSGSLEDIRRRLETLESQNRNGNWQNSQ
jgi:hypothetical protein